MNVYMGTGERIVSTVNVINLTSVLKVGEFSLI